MRPRHLIFTTSILLGALIGLVMSGALPVATAAPSGYKIPFFGKSVITNGPEEYLHTGRSAEAIDYSPRGGWSYIAATQAGTVVFSTDLRPATGFGQVIVIKHNDSGTYSYYGHLSSRSVSVGNVVYRGQTIGVVGNTGCGSCGIHLHFESRTGVVEPVTVDTLYNTGAAAWVRDIKGNGWFPWYPNPARNSGLVAYSPGYPSGECTANPAPLTVIWPKPSEITGGTYIAGFAHLSKVC
jgi:murein DD-endopeptidase MepM/ murein hydrolase activator NlpD